jgi:hypothetical protein
MCIVHKTLQNFNPELILLPVTLSPSPFSPLDWSSVYGHRSVGYQVPVVSFIQYATRDNFYTFGFIREYDVIIAAVARRRLSSTLDDVRE